MFCDKKLNYTLHTIYKIKHQGRNEILKQFINIINDGSDYKIIRIDIKDFFNEINRRDLFYKIKKDSFLGSLMIRKLNELDSFLIEDKCDGLPRGLSISSTLSELYLRNFDSSIKSNDNVYFYGRYVDDIIVVCLDNVYAVDDLIKKSLNNIGLSVNDKYEIIDDIKSDFCFDYLGVKFKSSNGKIEQLLSSKKIRKIKSRIIKSILDYRVNNDDVLLLDRLLFLSSNYHLYTRTESNNLKAGIYYNNQFINSYYQLSELNTFLRKSITARRGTLYKVVKKYHII
ncbi:hypothetical protein CRG86_014760 [Photobacterium leiognathi]|nr:hypothetical protein CRG86_014760 [Photobacterium leiognathi]